MAGPKPLPLLPAAGSSLPHCCQAPLFLLWAPCPGLCIADIQAWDWEGAGPARPTAKPKAVCSHGTHSIASSAASWQGTWICRVQIAVGLSHPQDPWPWS